MGNTFTDLRWLTNSASTLHPRPTSAWQAITDAADHWTERACPQCTRRHAHGSLLQVDDPRSRTRVVHPCFCCGYSCQ